MCIRRLANTVDQTARQVHRVSVVLNGSPIGMVKGTGRIPTQLRGWWSAAGRSNKYVSSLFTDMAGAQMRDIAQVDAVWFPAWRFDS